MAVAAVASWEVGPARAAVDGLVDADAVEVTLTVNGAPRVLRVDPRTTLLDALRDHLDLTGTKKGCDHGQCGACTVLVEGRRVNSCLLLAVAADGDAVTTVEGLEVNGELSAVQAAFLEQDALQCGYCTPGQVCSATALVEELRRGDASVVSFEASPVSFEASGVEVSDAEIRERMSGNLCRCGAYPNIVRAVRAVLSAGNAGGVA